MDNSQSRLYVSGLYTYHAQSDMVLPGGTHIDMLRDLPLDGGAEPVRQKFQFQASLFKRGLGGRLTANWKAPRVIRDVGRSLDGTPDSLHISSLASANLNVFANLDQIIGRRMVSGTRVSAGVDNLFNARRKVQGESGAVSLLFQSPYLDPLGRVVSISLRKAW